MALLSIACRLRSHVSPRFPLAHLHSRTGQLTLQTRGSSYNPHAKENRSDPVMKQPKPWAPALYFFAFMACAMFWWVPFLSSYVVAGVALEGMTTRSEGVTVSGRGDDKREAMKKA